MKIRQLLIMVFMMSMGHQLNAQELYSGVWRAGNEGYYLWSGVNWKDFNQKWNELANQNLRLTDIETYTVGSNRYFTGIWKEGSDGYLLTPYGYDWAAFNKFWSDNSKKGFRLIDIETFNEGGKQLFLGVFRSGSEGYLLTPAGLDWAAFNKFWSDNGKKGFRLTDIETYTQAGKRYFLGVFRAGNDGYVLSPYGKDWNQFVDYWKEKAAQNLRLVDIESYVENGKRIFLGVWREGGDAHYLWHGVDWQSLTSKWAENNMAGLRLIDVETFETNCPGKCLNNALMADNKETEGRDTYDYGVKVGKYHCEGQPNTCPEFTAANATVKYRWPNLKLGDEYYLRNSVLFDAKDQIFTLPFKDKSSDMSHNGWLYSEGSWHHALDYSRKDGETFKVCASAAGKVIHIGWDNWSGGTMVVSHDAAGKKDVYRTIYMHLRNGADNDCEKAWTLTVPTLGTDPDPAKNVKANYKNYLKNTGCKEDKDDRDPKDAWWGNNSTHKIDMTMLNKNVTAGQTLAWAGSTGPGGCGCSSGGNGPNTHLHIFFAHRDPTDNQWYLFDPYGIYAYGDCYPEPVDAAITNGCNRYPVAWKNGKPGYAP